ncbi:MAG: hypothetical protein MJZ31_09495 [Bacteroidales bacterium]|nr:hypothetical protein [Bacteroidales bacterium]
MKNYFQLLLVLVICIGFTTACNNSSSKTSSASAVSSALEIDDLLANAESLTDKEVTIEGVCTHTCKHGARKIFLMGTDNTKTIRVEACKLGAFDTKCIKSVVRVTGTLVEDRIDEAYLQSWENQLTEKELSEENTATCDTEKSARGETANTTAGRIADYRKRIETRQITEGKPYLSFYHINAISYEIVEQ